jgi:hypothetical protein
MVEASRHHVAPPVLPPSGLPSAEGKRLTLSVGSGGTLPGSPIIRSKAPLSPRSTAFAPLKLLNGGLSSVAVCLPGGSSVSVLVAFPVRKLAFQNELSGRVCAMFLAGNAFCCHLYQARILPNGPMTWPAGVRQQRGNDLRVGDAITPR